MHCYAVFTKRKDLKFDSMFVLLVLKVLFPYRITNFLFYHSTSEHAIAEKSRDKTVTKTKPNLTVFFLQDLNVSFNERLKKNQVRYKDSPTPCFGKSGQYFSSKS